MNKIVEKAFRYLSGNPNGYIAELLYKKGFKNLKILIQKDVLICDFPKVTSAPIQFLGGEWTNDLKLVIDFENEILVVGKNRSFKLSVKDFTEFAKQLPDREYLEDDEKLKNNKFIKNISLFFAPRIRCTRPDHWMSIFQFQDNSVIEIDDEWRNISVKNLRVHIFYKRKMCTDIVLEMNFENNNLSTIKLKKDEKTRVNSYNHNDFMDLVNYENLSKIQHGLDVKDPEEENALNQLLDKTYTSLDIFKKLYLCDSLNSVGPETKSLKVFQEFIKLYFKKYKEWDDPYVL